MSDVRLVQRFPGTVDQNACGWNRGPQAAMVIRDVCPRCKSPCEGGHDHGAGKDWARLSRFCGLTRMTPPRGLSMSAMNRNATDTSTGSTRSSWIPFRPCSQRTPTAPWMCISARKRRWDSRRTGFPPWPAKRGFPTSASTAPPQRISTGSGCCRTSKRCNDSSATTTTPHKVCTAHARCWLAQHGCVVACQSASLQAMRDIAGVIRSPRLAE
jgi:hypothetical protein